MTFEEMEKVVSAITYKPGWDIGLYEVMSGRSYIQIRVDETSDASLDASGSGERIPWRSGKRYLSAHMTRQEIVSAVFGLIADAEMHEAREWFRYKGASIFNPHLDPDVLAQVARKKSSFVFRENAMSMQETSS